MRVEVKLGIKQTLIGLLAPFVMLYLVFKIEWDANPTYVDGRGPTDTWDPSFVVRGDLPFKYRYWQTMDSRFPGGLYEPTIRWLVGGGALWRRVLASYVWAGLRNRAQGLAKEWGKKADGDITDPFDPAADKTGWTQLSPTLWRFERASDGVWKEYKQTGPIRWSMGYEIYKLTDGAFWAANLFSARWKS